MAAAAPAVRRCPATAVPAGWVVAAATESSVVPVAMVVVAATALPLGRSAARAATAATVVLAVAASARPGVRVWFRSTRKVVPGVLAGRVDRAFSSCPLRPTNRKSRVFPVSAVDEYV